MIDKECICCRRYHLKSCEGIENRGRDQITHSNMCSGFLQVDNEGEGNMKETVEVTIKMEKVDSGQYYCKGQRLSFALPWYIYRVNGDMYIPYYRIYFNECLMCMKSSEEQCYEYIKNISYEEAHIAEM